MEREVGIRREMERREEKRETEIRDPVYSSFFQDQEYVRYPGQSKIQFTPTEREIELIRWSWKQMLLDSTSKSSSPNQLGFNSSFFASSLFCHQLYDNLLEMKPELQVLFPSIKHQAIAFAGIMNAAINNLESLNVLDGILEQLGKTHARILGVQAPFFEVMGDALIKTFQDRFNKSQLGFTIELENCWINLFCFLANSILLNGDDPVLRYDLPPRSLTRDSIASSAASVDRDSIFEEKLTRQTTGTTIDSKSSTIKTATQVKRSAMSSTRQAFKSITQSSTKLKPVTTKKQVATSKKDKDGTCIVM